MNCATSDAANSATGFATAAHSATGAATSAGTAAAAYSATYFDTDAAHVTDSAHCDAMEAE